MNTKVAGLAWAILLFFILGMIVAGLSPLWAGPDALRYLTYLPLLVPIVIMLVVVLFVLAAGTDETGVPDETSSLDWQNQNSFEHPDPVEVLNERYASGEISVEEYEKRLGVLLDLDSVEDAKRRIEHLQGTDVESLEDLLRDENRR